MKEIIKKIKREGYDYEIKNEKLMVEIWWGFPSAPKSEWFEIQDLIHFNALDHWGPTLKPGVWEASKELQGY